MLYLTLIRNMVAITLATLVSVACVHDPMLYGSPSHTHRLDVHKSWEYYYYPEVEVYLHLGSGFYYYRLKGNWVRARTLPHHFYLNPRNRVRLHVDSDKPYLFHHEHKKKYRPRKQYIPPPGEHRKRHDADQDGHRPRPRLNDNSGIAPAPDEFRPRRDGSTVVPRQHGKPPSTQAKPDQNHKPPGKDKSKLTSTQKTKSQAKKGKHPKQQKHKHSKDEKYEEAVELEDNQDNHMKKRRHERDGDRR